MNQEQRKNEVAAITEIAMAIRHVGRIPSGHLYASLMGCMGFSKYQDILATLTRAGLIKVTGSHEIIYTGEI
jgi:hypothetical protein